MIIIKKLFIWIIITLFISVVILSIVYFTGITAETGEFNLDYYEITENDYKAFNVGKIKNAKDAKKAGKRFFKDSFGVNFLNNFPPYHVSYDKNNDVWLVQASSIFGKNKGGYVIFSSNGDIIDHGGVKF